MSGGWEKQGRQDHGWFGHGTGAAGKSADGADDDPMFAASAVAARIQAVIQGSVGALLAKERTHAAAQPSAAAVDRLTGLMTDWSRAATLDRERFAALFFDRDANDPVVERLRSAAGMAAEARSHAELREAAEALAAAQQLVGLDRWTRFVADAERRASDPATIENVAMATKSESPLDRREEPLGRPEPVEKILEAGAALLTGGGSAVVKTIGRKIIERIASRAKVAAEEATSLPGKAAPTKKPVVDKPIKILSEKPSDVTPRPDLPPLAGGRGGEKVPELIGPPNSAIPAANPNRIYISRTPTAKWSRISPDGGQKTSSLVRGSSNGS